MRVDDKVAFVFRLTRDVTNSPYELQVGDQIRVESLTAQVQAQAQCVPDGVGMLCSSDAECEEFAAPAVACVYEATSQVRRCQIPCTHEETSIVGGQPVTLTNYWSMGDPGRRAS